MTFAHWLIWGGVAAGVLFVLVVYGLWVELARGDPDVTVLSFLFKILPAIAWEEFKLRLNETREEWQEWLTAKKAEWQKEQEKTGRIPVWRSVVLLTELRGWPLVRHSARGRWSMLAVHTAPGRMAEWGGMTLPVVTGIAYGVWMAKDYEAAGYKAVWLPGLFYGVPAFVISIPVWWLLLKTWLVVRFVDGAIEWYGPDRRWRYFKFKSRVAAGEARSLQVIAPHRKAAEESRDHADTVRRKPRESAPKALFQNASELVMHSGPGGGRWQTVAEFCNDASGQKAHRLQQAIELVAGLAAEELTERVRVVVIDGPL